MLHRSMSRLAVMLSSTTLLLAISPLAHAAEPDETLNQLRQSYAESREATTLIERPKRGSADTREKRKVWDAVKKKRQAAHSLVPALLAHWISLPDESKELSAIREEIKAVYDDMAGSSLTKSNPDEKSFFANAVWPLVCDDKLTSKRAAFLVELTEPHLGVRINDNLAQFGAPTEPFGWNIQDAHSLALLRAGRIDDARRENELLLNKVILNLERGQVPNVTVNYRKGKRTNQSLRREYLLHRALIEAVSGDKEGAKKRLAEVKQTKEDEEIAAKQKHLVQEIENRIGS